MVLFNAIVLPIKTLNASNHQHSSTLTMQFAIFLVTIVAAASLASGDSFGVENTSSAAFDFDWTSGRIAGGRDAQRHSAPWIVSLQWGPRTVTMQHCGGSIITASWVVTAAHCYTNRQRIGTFIMLAGRHNLRNSENTEQRRNINRARIFLHPRYVQGREVGPFDIALIHAAPAFQLNQFVQVIALPAANTIPHGQFTLHGWGSISTTERPIMPAILQTVTKPGIPFQQCRQILGAQHLDVSNMCTGPLTGGVSACGGDSGGPLVQNRQLVGVVSWGVNPCGSRGAPSVYVRTSAFIDWIQQTMRR